MFKYVYNILLTISTIMLSVILSYMYNIYVSIVSLGLIYLISREVAWFVESYWYRKEAMKHGFYFEFLTTIVKNKNRYNIMPQYHKISTWYDEAMRKHVRQILSSRNKVTK